MASAFNLLRTGRVLFAATMIVIGIVGLARGDFAPIWQPVSHAFPGREFLIYLCALVSLVSGAGLLLGRIVRPAALLLLVYLCIWTAVFRLPFILRQPLVEGGYQSCGENLVLISAIWVLLACVDGNSVTGPIAKLSSPLGLKVAYVLYGLALIAFGGSHFTYLNLTAPLVPTFLGVPTFWAYLTGSIYIVTGLAILTGIARRLGAILAAIQIALITFLVWGPMVASGAMSQSSWGETLVSWALTVGAVIIAASIENQTSPAAVSALNPPREEAAAVP